MIRKATVKDARIPGMIDRSNNDPVNERINLTAKEITHEFRESIRKKECEAYVYDNDKGFVALKKEFHGYNNCEISWLNVKKEVQRKGLGKKLVKLVEKRAKSLGFRGIYLFTHEMRKDSHEFYKKLGYKKINKFPNYYSNGDTSYMFGKLLK